MSDETKTRNPRDVKGEAEVGGTTICCRVPSRNEYDAYLWSLKKRGSLIASKELILATAEKPSGEELEVLFDKLPALPVAFADELENLAGGDVECESTMDTITATFGSGKDKEVFEFSAPSQPDHDAVVNASKSPKEKPGVFMRTFLNRCYAGDASLDDLFDRSPACIGAITVELRQIAGASFEFKVKKG